MQKITNTAKMRNSEDTNEKNQHSGNLC